MTRYTILGYRVASSTSARRKWHTALAVTSDSPSPRSLHTTFTAYGPGGADGTLRSVAVGGASAITNAAQVVREAYITKRTKRNSQGAIDYDRVIFPLQVVVLDLPSSVPPTQKEFLELFNAQAGGDVYFTDVEAVQEFVRGNSGASTSPSTGSTVTPETTDATPVEERAPRLRVDGPVLRPNGEEYRPRDVGGHADVALLRKMRETGINVRLYGPPGTGKTAMAEAAFGDCITVNGHGDMTVAHFAGTLLPTATGGWEWNDGPLTRAMKEGKMLFVDEITRIPTEVLAVLYSVMDGRGVLNLDDRPDVPPIHAEPGFGVIAGYNPDTLGARELDEALVSRFRVPIAVTSDFDMALTLGVPRKAVRLAKNLSTQDASDRADGGPGIWVPQMRELLTFRDLVNAGMDEAFSAAVLVSSCPRSVDLPIVQDAARQVFGYDVAPLQVAGAVR